MENAFIGASIIAMALCSVAAVTDLRTGRIPNWLNGLALGAGLCLGASIGGWQGLGMALTGALVAIAVPLLLFRLDAMGGGDLKLFGAIGSLVGVEMVLQIQLLSFFFGALAGVVVWCRKGILRNRIHHLFGTWLPFRTRRVQASEKIDTSGTRILFAPAIWIGGVLLLVVDPLIGKGMP